MKDIYSIYSINVPDIIIYKFFMADNFVIHSKTVNLMWDLTSLFFVFLGFF